jgi:hypothetical protein
MLRRCRHDKPYLKGAHQREVEISLGWLTRARLVAAGAQVWRARTHFLEHPKHSRDQGMRLRGGLVVQRQSRRHPENGHQPPHHRRARHPPSTSCRIWRSRTSITTYSAVPPVPTGETRRRSSPSKSVTSPTNAPRRTTHPLSVLDATNVTDGPVDASSLVVDGEFEHTRVTLLPFFAPSACQYRMVPSNATGIWIPSAVITPAKSVVPDASLNRPVPPVNV